MRTGSQIFALAALAIVTAGPVAGQAIDHAREYRACLGLVDRDPETAFESALAWRDLGGGAAAGHCAGLALVAMGHPARAAQQFQTAAMQMPVGANPGPADLLAQAANAWLLAERPDAALEAIEAALVSRPNDPLLRIDRARVQAERGRYGAALADLDAVLAVRADDPAWHAWRAAALRRLARLDEALAAADAGLKLEANHPESLLERGLALRSKGDIAAARRDLHAVTLNAPGTPVAEAARHHLQALERPDD